METRTPWTQRIKLFLWRWPILILFVYWALTQLAVFLFSGVKTSVDTAMYVQCAKDLLLHFKIEDAHDFWYLSYSTVLALISTFTDSFFAVAFFQIFVSGLALLSLYKAVLTISSDKSVAFIACFLFVFWFEIHTWNTFIYTESLFVSCSVITFYFLVHSKTRWQTAFTFVFIFFSCLIRPAGFSLLVASMCYFFVKLEVPAKTKIFAVLTTTCLIFMLLNKMLESYELISSYLRGEIIYPNLTLLINRAQFQFRPSTTSSLFALIEFIFHHPIYFFELCAIKLALFFGHVKPYFSLVHNCYIVIVLYPLYFFAYWSYRTNQLSNPALVFLLSFVALQGATVMLTTENWDGRFLMPVLPFIFILSAFGIRDFLRTRISVP